MGIQSDRGQSSTLAIAVVMVLALTSALAIAGIGTLTLEEGRRVVETESGVQAMTELDSRASLVALEGGDSVTIDFNARDRHGGVSVNDSGEMRFVLRNTSSNTRIWNESTSLGTVTYANGDARIAYQGGGVWRSDGGTGSVMIAPPEVHYEHGTLTLPLIRVAGAARGSSSLRIEETGQRNLYPSGSEESDRTNPVPEGTELSLFVTSDYYQAWASFFRTRIGGNVSVFHENRTVRVDLAAPVARFKIDSGLISVGTGSPIDMQGSGGNPTFVDSYDSTRGNYSTTQGKNGTVRSPAGLELGGNTFIKGTVDTGGTVKLSGNDNLIDGDAYHQGLVITGANNTITGETAPTGSGVEIPAIDGQVTSRVNTICANGTTDLGEGGTLDAGDYCHNGDLTLNGETLTVNLSAGNVTLAVDGDLTLKNDGKIAVVDPGDNTTRLWLGGSSVEIVDGNVSVPEQQSPAMRLFAKSDTTVKMTSESTYVGLLYAPSSSDSGGRLRMKSDSDLYGSAVIGKVSMQSGSAVHYDQALGGFTFDRQDTPVSHLSYLYITVNEIRAEER